MNKGYIYRLYNVTNNKCYYGSTINIKSRRNVHLSSLKGNYHINQHLQNAWNKYGKDKFKFEIVEKNISRDKLLEREQWWLNYTKCYLRKYGYNSNPIAELPPSQNGKIPWNKGVTHSKKTRKKLSLALKGRKNGPHSEETKQKIRDRVLNNPDRMLQIKKLGKQSQWKKGRKQSIESIIKRSKSNSGKKRTIEQRKRMSLAQKNKRLTPEHIKKLKDAWKRRKNNIGDIVC